MLINFEFTLVCKSVSSPIFLMFVQRAICGQTEVSAPCYQSLSFVCSILAHSRKTLHESSKIFVAHALHVARIQLQAADPDLQIRKGAGGTVIETLR